ncbi:hypothetical protein Lser_V15G16947 [Lactuca serriola]
MTMSYPPFSLDPYNKIGDQTMRLTSYFASLSGKNMEEVDVVVELITKLHEGCEEDVKIISTVIGIESGYIGFLARPQRENAEELAEVKQMIKTPDFFNKLVESMAPTVFGHQDIKRAILLMLLGGVHKFTHEGINIRGASMFVLLEIQIVLNLSFSISRSFYTSGKSSYVVGLAATVAKEPETGEFCIEILVLCNWATKDAGVSDERQGSDSKSVVELTNGSSVQ